MTERNTLNKRIFLTDGDFRELFGDQIYHLVGLMNAAAGKICPPCNGYCCRNINCGFYSEYFSTCPIFDRRPRECRYHFCNEVFNAAPLTKDEKDLMQQPVEELICGDRGEIARLFFLFPEFPLDEKGLISLGIGDEVAKIKAEFEEGRISQDIAFARLRKLTF
ncbi:MAG: hypothetical protein NTY79_03540 [Chloroflexi bacterium]|nr:hypothetical protein [Chloroflexota bacterium]